MQKQEMEITVGPDGKVSVRVSGAKGGECLELTKDLEDALGQVSVRERTAEFYEQPPAGTEQKIGTR